MKRPDPESRVDLQFRNGEIKRNEPAHKWRFGEWTGKDRHNHPHPWDIVKWQLAKETKG